MNTTKITNSVGQFIRRTVMVLTLVIGLTSIAQAETTQHYAGTFNDIPATLVLIWENPKGLESVFGSLSFSGESFELTGSNPEEGYLVLEDESGNRFELTKTVAFGQITWSGAFNSNTPVTFSRNL